MARVIVGIDGSRVAHEAVAFAADEARMREAVLQVAHVRRPTPSPRLYRGAEFASAEVLDQIIEMNQRQAEAADKQDRQASEQLLARAVASVDTGTVTVEQTSLVDRRPARRLLELVAEHDDVELLVVGSRGRGELTGMLLGSVSLACVTHAQVPVTVVHQSRG